MPTISIIAAMGKNRELGAHGRLPWHLPDDLRRFKELTQGHTVIMGRKTYASIGKPLPNRKNIVVTRNKDYAPPGCLIAGSIEDALKMAGGDEEVFVIGGAEIYRLALPYVDKMYLTNVDAAPEADVYFPEFDESAWRVTKTESHRHDEKHPYPFVFKVYEKK